MMRVSITGWDCLNQIDLEAHGALVHKRRADKARFGEVLAFGPPRLAVCGPQTGPKIHPLGRRNEKAASQLILPSVRAQRKARTKGGKVVVCFRENVSASSGRLERLITSNRDRREAHDH